MVYATSNATKLTAVPLPEPSTWALMALGFAGLGVAWRRRALALVRAAASAAAP
ncbi:MAG: PEP-CTERM sorting domain-containing protein [Hyphomicrobiales bacterium]|nr:PEP-CTERM sorting domain-containing protein [Hyphomicrobiales bacterium]